MICGKEDEMRSKISLIIAIFFITIITGCSLNESSKEQIDIYEGVNATVEMNEGFGTLEETIEMSEVVAEIEFKDKGEVKQFSIYDSSGIEIMAIVDVKLVEAKVLKEYRNITGDKKITIALPYGRIPGLSFDLLTNKKYVVNLVFNQELDAYNLVSFGNGFFEVSDDTILSTAEKVDYKEYIKLVDKVNKK